MNDVSGGFWVLSVFKSTAEPRRPLRRGKDVKCLLSIWSSRCATAELFSGWGRTLFSPGGLSLEVRSACAAQSEPSASPPPCCISAPACGVYTWEKTRPSLTQFGGKVKPKRRRRRGYSNVGNVAVSYLNSCSFMLSWRARSVYRDISVGSFLLAETSGVAKVKVESVSVDICACVVHLWWSYSLSLQAQPIRSHISVRQWSEFNGCHPEQVECFIWVPEITEVSGKMFFLKWTRPGPRLQTDGTTNQKMHNNVYQCAQIVYWLMFLLGSKWQNIYYSYTFVL